jgi:hypothetical protein
LGSGFEEHRFTNGHHEFGASWTNHDTPRHPLLLTLRRRFEGVFLAIFPVKES